MEALIAKIVNRFGKTVYVNYIAKCINKRAEIEPNWSERTLRIVEVKSKRKINFFDRLC